LCSLILIHIKIELHATRDQKKAEGFLLRSLEIRKSLLGENHHLVSRLYHDIAVVKDYYVCNKRKNKRKEKGREREREEKKKKRKEERIEKENCDYNNFFPKKGLHEEAIHLHHKAIQIRENTLGPDNPQLAVSWENLGMFFFISLFPYFFIALFLCISLSFIVLSLVSFHLLLVSFLAASLVSFLDSFLVSSF
jgi:Tetratricopeptide repeat